MAFGRLVPGIDRAGSARNARFLVLRVLAFNAGLLAVGLVMLELAFGAWWSPLPPDPAAVLKNVSLRFDASGVYARGSNVLYVRDRHGLRGRYASPGLIDVLTVGGSTTDQRYVSEGETFQDLLADCLSTPDQPVSVVNAGADGLSTVGILHAFGSWFRRIPDLAPRYVVAYVGINDAHVILSGGAQSPSDSRDSLASRFKSRSATWKVIATVRGMYLSKFGGVVRLNHGAALPTAGRFVQSPAELSERERVLAQALASRLAEYRERLSGIAAGTRALGASPVFVTQAAAFFRRNPDDSVEFRMLEGGRERTLEWYATLRLVNLATLESCRATGAACIDLERGIRFSSDDFYDYIHTTPSGSKRIADFLCPRMRATLADGRRTPTPAVRPGHPES